MVRRIPQSVLLGVAVVAIFAAAIAVYYLFFFEPKAPSETFKDEYELTLKDFSGNEVRLSEFKREILVVHSWASWCVYCGKELENLASLKDVYGNDIVILAVNRAESLVEAQVFTDGLRIPPERITFLLDPDDAFYRQIEGYAMPETIFIRKNGDVLFQQHGPIDIDAVTANINLLLGKEVIE